MSNFKVFHIPTGLYIKVCFDSFTGWFGDYQLEHPLECQPNEDKYYMLDKEGLIFNTSMPFKMAEKLFIKSICSYKVLTDNDWEYISEAELIGIEI